jgi:two-component system, sensor histidine kinase
MRRIWKDLSVSKKLYVVVGVMALLIATELFTLLFAMNILSAVRSFVGGEGLWSKAQKNAIYSLHRYATTGEARYYQEFTQAIQIPLGDRYARIELEKPNPNAREIKAGFVRGQIHPDDVPGLVTLIQNFHTNQYVSRALKIWRQADLKFDDLITSAEELNHLIVSGEASPDRIHETFEGIDRTNQELTKLESEFSAVLGEGSRWMERMLMILLVLAVLTVETTGVILTIAFSRNLSRTLKELSDTAQEVGKGNFSSPAPVRSRDELGQLAEAINAMISDLKRNTGQRVRAENANQVKTLFLASMSHEIRTPLGVILGLAEILKEPNLSRQDQIKYIETIEKTGQNLTRILNDILDISKVETGHFEIEKSTFSLSDFLKDLESMMRVKAEKEKNQLVFVRQGDFRDRVSTDRIRLRQILVNLINNALKFTQNGTVTVTFWEQNQILNFQIQDTGAGIPLESQERLFQAFYQAEEGSQHAEGSGLGLVLSKRLAQALGGDVVLKESQVKRGSTFLATIRNEQIEDSRIKPELKPMQGSTLLINGLADKKVLVVEDVLDNQMLTKLYLARKGMEVQFAQNGAEGVQKALDQEFDLILMDMQMPVMDGYTATKQLRDKGYQKPIIALTAHAMKEDRERCLQSGCDDYLTKPLDANVLYSVISKNLIRSAEYKALASETSGEASL